jgi:nucleolar protein 58
MEASLKEAAEISMGTEISPEDLSNIQALCEQVIAIHDYRNSLYDYLKNRMNAIAPNLSVMVGELVGARLISHAGSLLNLAKHPASTVQILGAEKALFRALKTKHETPKYGLLYHASLVGQAAPKLKGKMARVLAAKTALSIRVDALGDNVDASVGLHHREQVEARLRQLESGKAHAMSGSAKGKAKQDKFTPKSAVAYNAASDSTLVSSSSSKKKLSDDFESEKKEKKRKVEEVDSDEEQEKKSKKDKKEKKKKHESSDDE